MEDLKIVRLTSHLLMNQRKHLFSNVLVPDKKNSKSNTYTIVSVLNAIN